MAGENMREQDRLIYSERVTGYTENARWDADLCTECRQSAQGVGVPLGSGMSAVDDSLLRIRKITRWIGWHIDTPLTGHLS